MRVYFSLCEPVNLLSLLLLVAFVQLVSPSVESIRFLVTVQVPTCLVLDKSGPISKAMVDECENWATNCRHRWPC